MSLYDPFIIVPPLTNCLSSYIVFGQGTPPYTIYPIWTGGTGESLENIPLQTNSVPFEWTVDFGEGANLTWVVVDGEGKVAYSGFRVVQGQIGPNIISCGRNNYDASSKTHYGVILGAVLGSVALLIVLTVLGVCYFRRRTTMARSNSLTRSEQDFVENSSVHSRLGIIRSGTFNLRQRPGVEFHQYATDQPPPEDAPPPKYSHKQSERGSELTASSTAASVLMQSRPNSPPPPPRPANV